MANCIAKATGIDKSRAKETTRLGSESARAVAATWVTKAEAFVRADGSGFVSVIRNGSVIHLFEFNPE